ncbi:hypothetical protein [Pelagicoccus albus]|uniref:Tetratricopeptide repeat protein n=1 Tax=Pelagicoccus albus TaxID=415222 RepID=A0A7X1E8H7_9BACT|nr:hypothetical protein [Pelagicoccus albus]MBC2606276.1 hypothetical protein [Pelagicoccus albus]
MSEIGSQPPSSSEEKSSQLSTYELSIKLHRSGWVNVGLLAGAILFSGSWLGWKYFARENQKQLTAASIAWNEENPEQAWSLLQKVNRNSGNVESYDFQSALILGERNPERLLSEQGIEKTKTAHLSLKRQKLMLQAAIAAQDWLRLEAFISTLESDPSFPDDDPDLLIGQAWLSLRQGEIQPTQQKILAALRANPSHSDAQLLRSQLQGSSADPMERNQARQTLKELSESHSPEALKAQIALITSPLRPRETDRLRSLLGELKRNPYFSSHYLLKKPAVLKTLLNANGELDSELGLDLAQRLERSGDADENELLMLAYYAQEQGELELAKTKLTNLQSEGEPSYQLRYLVARQALIEGDTGEAIAEALPGLESEGSGQFARLLLQIAQNKTVSNEHRQDATAALIEQEELPFPLWLAAAGLAWEQGEQMRNSAIASGLEQASKYPLEVARFLAAHEEAAKALEILEQSGELRKSPLGFGTELSCLVKLERYQEAKALLSTSEVYISSLTLASGRLLLAFATGSAEEVQNLWKKGIALAAEETNVSLSLGHLAKLAFDYQQPKLALEAFRKSSQAGPLEGLPSQLLLSYLELERQQGNTERCLQLAKLCENQNPDNLAIRAWTAYFQVLLDQEILNAKDTLSRILQSNSSLPLAQDGLTLAFLKTGQPKRALALLPEELETDGQASSRLAIWYATLEANQASEKAQAIRAEIDVQALLPEEKSLLESYAPSVREKIELPSEEELQLTAPKERGPEA